jgi:16S rRNA C967 or C1407 C5-methylase (RsmB/RsmF family)
MGRRWSKKKKGRGGGGDASSNSNKKVQRFPNQERLKNSSYTPAWQLNRRMEAYYAYQGIHDLCWNEEAGEFQECTTDEQKTHQAKTFMETCKRILPASFRIGTDVDPIIRERLEHELDQMVGQELELILDDGSTIKIAPARRIPFIPHAYQLAVDRHTIRKNPTLSTLFEWLKVQTEAGFITRQETVSMIPPIVMDVQPHHAVLDLCAAPGSKTSQILELVSQIEPNEKEPRGIVVANDADPKRAYMLVHQLKRIHSPAALVTACDAQFFPLLWKEQGEGMFDRVLADVPCSGDGTMRKNAQVWKKWSALNSYSLHPLQLSIALTGARLTKAGGILVYSTCSMSPTENEAVVAELLRLTDGSLELIERRLPGLRARPGLSSWHVLREDQSKRKARNQANKQNAKMKERRDLWDKHQRKVWKNGEQQDESETFEEEREVEAADEDHDKDNAEDDDKDNNGDFSGPLGPPESWDQATLGSRCGAEGFQEYKSFDEVENQWKRTCRQSCFPPTQQEAEQMQLHHCLRFLPHDMDTSGFFVAVFRKTQPLSAKARERAATLATELRADIGDQQGREVVPPAKKRKLDPQKQETNLAEVTSAVDEDTGRLEDAKEMEEGLPDGEASEEPAEEPSVQDSEQPQLGKVVKGTSYFRGRGAPKGNMGNENFVCANREIVQTLSEYYGLSDFPGDQLMCRGVGDTKAIYFIAKSVKKFLDGGLQDRVTIVNSGLKAFDRNSQECEVRYRIAQEGIHFIVPYMTTRKFVISIRDFVKCLGKGAIKLSTFTTQFAEGVRQLNTGSFVVLLEGYETDIPKKLMMVMWRCRGDNINCLVTKIERDGMRSKLRAITGEELDDDMDETRKPDAEEVEDVDYEHGDAPDEGDS